MLMYILTVIVSSAQYEIKQRLICAQTCGHVHKVHSFWMQPPPPLDLLCRRFASPSASVTPPPTLAQSSLL